MYPELKIMHMLNFLDTLSMGITVSFYICGKWNRSKEKKVLAN